MLHGDPIVAVKLQHIKTRAILIAKPSELF